MKLSYKKLWVMLVERDLKKTEFAKNANKDLCKSLKVTTNFLDVLEAALKLSKKYSIINHE